MLARAGSDAAVSEVIAALTQGGRELAVSKRVFPATLQKIEQHLVDFDGMAPVANRMWQACIDAGMTPAELRKKRNR
jgi:hypothetical protein